MNVHVPTHLTPDWITREVSRKMHLRGASRAARKTTYLHPKKISIRQYIALAEQLKRKQ
jgi:hypothetical protein